MVDNVLSSEEQALIKEIQGEGGDLIPEAVAQARTQSVYYKLRNPSPGGAPLTPGEEGFSMIVGRDPATNEPIIEHAPKLSAVILYAADVRTFRRGKQGEVVCQSYNGEQPAPKIENPPCEKLTADGVAAIIGKFRGMEKAKVDSRVAELVDTQGKLSFCTIKTATGGFIPLCPMARYDEERGAAGPCKPGVSLMCYDVVNQRMFSMEIGGRNIDNRPAKFAPYQAFRSFCGNNRVPMHAFVCTFTAVPDGGASPYYTLGLSWKPIAKPENRKEMEDKALEAREAFMRKATWVPKPKDDGEGMVAPKPEPKQRQIQAVVPAPVEEDDINF